MRGLDAYITGQNIHYTDRVLHKCPKCGATKEVEMVYDMGGWFYTDEGAWCEPCQVEMEVMEEVK